LSLQTSGRKQGKFAKGQSGNPKGRAAGKANKGTVAAREAFQMAFDQLGGPKHLAKWAGDNETEFYKLFARLIPVDVNAKGDFTGKFVIEWKPDAS
jgi:hypothetical protein